MKLILSLSVLAVALLMVLEGPAPAQADSGKTDDLNLETLWSNVKGKVMEAFESIDWDWFPKTFSEAKEKIQKTFS